MFLSSNLSIHYHSTASSHELSSPFISTSSSSSWSSSFVGSSLSCSQPVSSTITKGNFRGCSGNSLKNEFITMKRKTCNNRLLSLFMSALRSFSSNVGFLVITEDSWDEFLSWNLGFLLNLSFSSCLLLLRLLFWNLPFLPSLYWNCLPLCPLLSPLSPLTCSSVLDK